MLLTQHWQPSGFWKKLQPHFLDPPSRRICFQNISSEINCRKHSFWLACTFAYPPDLCDKCVQKPLGNSRHLIGVIFEAIYYVSSPSPRDEMYANGACVPRLKRSWWKAVESLHVEQNNGASAAVSFASPQRVFTMRPLNRKHIISLLMNGTFNKILTCLQLFFSAFNCIQHHECSHPPGEGPTKRGSCALCHSQPFKSRNINVFLSNISWHYCEWKFTIN